jgi:phage shock protein E
MPSFSSKPSQSIQELLSKGALVVDVRSAREFASGHYKDSINMPLDTLISQVESLKASANPIVIVCLSGGRSAQAVHMLAAHGVEAYNGGGWQSLQ